MTRARLTVTLPNDELRAALGTLPEGVETAVWDLVSPAPWPRIDVVVRPFFTPLDRLHETPARLVQNQMIGYEDVVGTLPPGILFANAAGVHEASTAELAIALTLASLRELPAYAAGVAADEWPRRFVRSLADRRVLLLGYGGIGKAIARRLEPFEVDLTIVASRARTEHGVPVRGIDELPALLPAAEVVIGILPDGPATRGLIDADALAVLPDGALVVNVGRGTLIDTDALTAEVVAGRLRAALDVVDPEPLPAGHPLRTAAGAVLTPHVAGVSSAALPRTARLVRAQIDRLLAGEHPLNVVLGP